MIGMRIFVTASGRSFHFTTMVVPGNGLRIAGVSGKIPILNGMIPVFGGITGLSWGGPVRITMAIFLPALLGAVAKSLMAVSMAGPTRLPGAPRYLTNK